MVKKILRSKSNSTTNINTVVSIIGILIGVLTLLGIQLNSSKDLSYEVTTFTSMVDVKEDSEGKIDILFNGKKTLEPTMLVIKIINTGKGGITKDDYISPIKIKFPNNPLIMDAEIFNAHPYSLKDYLHEKGIDKLEIEKDTIILDKIDFNSGDNISIKIIFDKYKNKEFEVVGRIKGVGTISQTSQNKVLLFMKKYGLDIFSIIWMMVFLHMLFRSIKEKNKINNESSRLYHLVAEMKVSLKRFSMFLEYIQKEDSSLFSEISNKYERYVSENNNQIVGELMQDLIEEMKSSPKYNKNL